MRRLQITNEEIFQNGMNGLHTKKGKCIALTYGEDPKNDALFIQNAFNTANKCDMLPSELLQQRNEMLQMLEKLAKKEPFEGKVDFKLSELKEIEQLIKKATEI